jgi:hypothetical protein
MSLTLLKNATTLRSSSTPYFERVGYWIDKQQMLLVALEDLAGLSAAYFEARNNAPKYELDPRISLPDSRPKLRLALVVEAACSCVYAMTEVAANFANQLTRVGCHDGQLPGSFNQIKKQLGKGAFPQLAAQLGDLTWYEHLHAMRTEWAHFSTIFIGEDKDSVVVCGAALRRPCDREVLKSKFQVPLDEIRALGVASLHAMERFAGYLLPLVLRKFDLSAEIMVPELDKNGGLQFTPELLVKIKTTTVRDRLIELGLRDLCAKREAELRTWDEPQDP